MESKWMESAWNEGKEWCSWLTFIFRLSLMPTHPSSILAGNTEYKTRNLVAQPSLLPTLPLFFSLSLLKHQLCFSWPLSLRARCPGIQRERSSRYLWKKRRETERKRGRANCPSPPFIREGVRSARRHNGIKGEELEKRATGCVFPLFVSVGWPYLSRDCRSGMKRYPGRTMRTSLY